MLSLAATNVGLVADASPQSAIHVEGCENITVERNYTDGFPTGISVLRSDDVRVRDNEIHRTAPTRRQEIREMWLVRRSARRGV